LPPRSSLTDEETRERILVQNAIIEQRSKLRTSGIPLKSILKNGSSQMSTKNAPPAPPSASRPFKRGTATTAAAAATSHPEFKRPVDQLTIPAPKPRYTRLAARSGCYREDGEGKVPNLYSL
jgi:hypothetical protein